MRANRGERAIEHAERCGDQRLGGEKTRIRHQVAGFEIVRSVEHQVVTADQRHRVGGVNPGRVRRKPDVGIERMNPLSGAIGLAPADVGSGVNDLALQIGQRYEVIIDDAKRADAGRRQVHQCRRTESARADHQHGSVL